MATSTATVPAQDEPGPETSFDEPLGIIESKGVILFQSGTEIIAVDLNNKSRPRSVTRAVLRWGFRKGHSNAEHRPEIILVTDDAIRSVDYGGKETHSYPDRTAMNSCNFMSPTTTGCWSGRPENDEPDTTPAAES